MALAQAGHHERDEQHDRRDAANAQAGVAASFASPAQLSRLQQAPQASDPESQGGVVHRILEPDPELLLYFCVASF